jgi:hypothetical protein
MPRLLFSASQNLGRLSTIKPSQTPRACILLQRQCQRAIVGSLAWQGLLAASTNTALGEVTPTPGWSSPTTNRQGMGTPWRLSSTSLSTCLCTVVKTVYMFVWEGKKEIILPMVLYIWCCLVQNWTSQTHLKSEGLHTECIWKMMPQLHRSDSKQTWFELL